MVGISKFFYTSISIALLLFLSGCMQAKRTVNSLFTIADSECTTPLAATLNVVSGLNAGNVFQGDPVTFEVRASGCTGNYVIVTDDAVGDSFSDATLYTNLYMSPRTNYVEKIQIQSIDSKGNVADLIDVFSPSFNVLAPIGLSCTAVASSNTGTITVDVNGNVLTPAYFQVQVTPNTTAQVRAVLVGSTNTPVSGVPTTLGTSLNVSQIPVTSSGSTPLIFNIVDSQNRTANCGATVITTKVTTPAPVISVFSSSANSVSLGGTVTLHLETSNAATASINGQAVTLASGKGDLSVTLVNTGTQTYTATATGPGGTLTRALTITVKPSCTLTAQATSKKVGETYPFQSVINGQFTSATLSASGLANYSITPPTGPYTVTTTSISTAVQSAAGAATATLTVNGPNSTSAQCTASINTLAADPVPVSGIVVAYPQEPSNALSSTYTVSVNGTNIPVYNTNEISYAHFAFAGQVAVKVTVNQTVTSYVLSPKSYNVTSSSSGTAINITLDRPRKLLLNKVNSLTERLAIFADPLEENAPQLGASNVIDVTAYSGVDKTGVNNSTSGISNAISSVPTNGVLYFPPGKYRYSSISFKSNMTVYLAGGATLMANSTSSLNSNDGLLYFNGCSNVKVMGRGSIDGNGYYLRNANGGAEQGPVLIRVTSSSSNVTFQDVILKNAPNWTVVVFNATNWSIYNVKLLNDNRYAVHDGFDPIASSQNFVIDNSFVYTSDDGMAPNPTTSNYVMSMQSKNSFFFNNKSGANIRIGPGTGNNASGFTLENLDFMTDGNSIENNISIYPGGGMLKNIVFRNIRLERVATAPILFKPYWNYSGYSSGSGQLQNVSFSEIKQDVTTSQSSSLEAPSSSNYVDTVNFNNYFIAGNLVSNASSGKLSVGNYVTNLTFTSNPSQIVNVSANTLIASRSNNSAGQFTITRSGSTSQTLTVNYTLRGLAVNGTEYTSLPSSITIPAGASSATINVTPISGNFGDWRTVLLSLTNNFTTYMVGPNYHAMVSIRN